MVIKDKSVVKILVCGDSGVGKTEIVNALSDDILDYGGSTIGANFGIKRVSDDKKNAVISLQFWDVSGDTRFWHIYPLLAYGANLVLFVFDVTSKQSLEHVKEWYQFFARFVDNAPSIIVGNKIDLAQKKPDRRMLNGIEKIVAPRSVVFVSALKKINIETLDKAILDALTTKDSVKLRNILKKAVSIKVSRI